MKQSTTSTPRKILENLAVSGFTALVTIASSVAVALPAAAVSFNLSLTSDISDTINVVLTTSDPSPTPTANQTYTITGISGTINSISGSTQAITTLSTADSPNSGSPLDNTFQWDGGTNIGVTANGLGFIVDGLNYYLYNNNGGLISEFNIGSLSLASDSHPSGNSVTSLSLTPVVATPVPFEFNPSFGILALGGAWAVRKTIQKSKSGTVNN